jgi:glycosyltransferase involved in cell wall biosynthesis
MISFVVPAYNEEALIGQTLDALNRAGRNLGEPYEIVVADDASTDRTAAIAEQYRAHIVSVNLRQIAAARNAGAREAKGEKLVFVDADTVVTAEVVRAAVNAMSRGAAGGGCAVTFDGCSAMGCDSLSNFNQDLPRDRYCLRLLSVLYARGVRCRRRIR